MTKKRKKSHKKKFNSKTLIVLPVAIVLGLFIYRNFAKPAFSDLKTIRIGLILNTGGQYQASSVSTKNAAELAVKDINSDGGLKLGTKVYPVELIEKDAKGSIDLTEKAVKDLSDSNNVIAVIGPSSDHFAVSASDVANSSKLVMISPTSSDLSLTIDAKTGDTKRYSFRTALDNTSQVSDLAKFITGNLSIKSAAVMFDKSNPTLSQQADNFKSSFQTAGGNVVDSENFTPAAYDFAKQLSSIQNSGAGAMILLSSPTQALTILKEAKYMGLKIPILGTDILNNSTLLTGCLTDCDGTYLLSNFSPDLTTDEAKDFISEFKDAYNTDPDETAALTYDSFGILFQGLINAGSTNPQQLRDGISQISNYAGTTGIIKFNTSSNDPQRSAVILQIKDNKFNYFSSLNP